MLIKLLGACLIVMAATAFAADAGIEEFNHALIQATTRMDNSAALALWEEDGITLLPQTKPIVGKAAIARFLDDVSAQLAGAKMEKFEMQCFDSEIVKDWASEWCEEHQHVLLPNGKPPFDGRGKMLLILHRGSDGKWRMRREMWNEGMPDNSSKTE